MKRLARWSPAIAPGLQLFAPGGQRELVSDLAALWAAAERMAGLVERTAPLLVTARPAGHLDLLPQHEPPEPAHGPATRDRLERAPMQECQFDAGYDLDEVSIVPSRRTRDVDDVSTAWQIDAFRFDIPLVTSPSETYPASYFTPAVAATSAAKSVSSFSRPSPSWNRT